MGKAATGSKGRRGVRPRSERRVRKAAVLRQKLMACALRLFEKNGFTRTSIDSITEAADVGKGTFYNYYDTKEALLGAWGRTVIQTAIREALNDGAPGQPALRKIIRLFMALLEPIEERPRLAGPLVMAFLFLPLAPEVEDAQPEAAEGASPSAPSPSSPSSPPSPAGASPAAKAASAKATIAKPKLSADASASAPPVIHELVLPIVEEAAAQGAIRDDVDPKRAAAALAGIYYQTVMMIALGGAQAPKDTLRASLALLLEGLAPTEE